MHSEGEKILTRNNHYIAEIVHKCKKTLKIDKNKKNHPLQ